MKDKELNKQNFNKQNYDKKGKNFWLKNKQF